MRFLFSEKFVRILFVIIAAALHLAPIQAQTLVETAQPRILPPGAPKSSDVSIRSINPRFRSETEPHDTLEAIRNFHVTRLEWTYNMDKEFIDKVRSLNCTVQGAVCFASYVPALIPNPNDPNSLIEGPGVDEPGGPTFKDLCTQDLNGEPIIGKGWQWPTGWALIGCINNPLNRIGHLRNAQKLVDMGVDSIQQDYPEQNHHAIHCGACFCDYCMDKFTTFLQSQNLTTKQLNQFGIDDLSTFNYRSLLKQQNAPVAQSLGNWKGTNEELKQLFYTFQAEATTEFHRWWRSELNQYAGRYVPVSCNNYFGWDRPYYRVFDFGLRELNYKVFDIGVQEPIAKAANLYALSRHTTELGKLQCLTMPLNPELEYEGPEWISLTRKTLATTYAVGSWMQAPWDTFVHGKPRYFGQYSNYADLYAFIRALPQYFDNYEDAAAFGPDIEDGRWASGKPIAIKDGSGKVYAFARAVPGKTNQPIVIHLIDWAEKPEPFTLSVDPKACFGGQKVTVRLATPVPYDQQAHENAWETKNYQPLVKWTHISDRLITPMNIPALNPWGILIIEIDPIPH